MTGLHKFDAYHFPAGEYMGGHRESTEDTTEKETIGQLWEARSKGLCVFRLATKRNLREAFLGAVRGSA